MLISWYRSCSVVRSDFRELVEAEASIFEDDTERAMDGVEDSGADIFIHRSIHCFQRRASLSVPISVFDYGVGQLCLRL
jgi:hypothetical protein